MNDPDYRPVSKARYAALGQLFAEAPQKDGRFAGEPAEQEALARGIEQLFEDPGDDTIRFKRDEVMGLAGDLQRAQPRWSIGQYTAALASLIDPESLT